MKGIISKYKEYTPNPHFIERESTSNPMVDIPHWEICRPDYRKNLEPSDVVFFVVDRVVDGIHVSTFCNAIMVVQNRCSDDEAKRILGREWYKKHIQRLEEHKNSSGQYDGHTRHDDIIIGNKSKSIWLGEFGVAIELHIDKRFYQGLQERKNVKKIRNRFLTDDETRRLYRELTGKEVA